MDTGLKISKSNYEQNLLFFFCLFFFHLTPKPLVLSKSFHLKWNKVTRASRITVTFYYKINFVRKKTKGKHLEAGVNTHRNRKPFWEKPGRKRPSEEKAQGEILGENTEVRETEGKIPEREKTSGKRPEEKRSYTAPWHVYILFHKCLRVCCDSACAVSFCFCAVCYLSGNPQQ